MYEETITIDVDALREDMMNDCLGAFFVGGFVGGLINATEIEEASDEELVKIAKREGINLLKYKV